MEDHLIDQFADKTEHGRIVPLLAGAVTADGGRTESGA